jgi:hypothetical protein
MSPTARLGNGIQGSKTPDALRKLLAAMTVPIDTALSPRHRANQVFFGYPLSKAKAEIIDLVF